MFCEVVSLVLSLLSYHCMKSVQILSFFWSVFSCIRIEYGDFHSRFRILSECWKIRTRKNFLFGHFSRSVCLSHSSLFLISFTSDHFSEHLWAFSNSSYSVCPNVTTNPSMNLIFHKPYYIHVLFMFTPSTTSSKDMQSIHGNSIYKLLCFLSFRIHNKGYYNQCSLISWSIDN